MWLKLNFFSFLVVFILLNGFNLANLDENLDKIEVFSEYSQPVKNKSFFDSIKSLFSSSFDGNSNEAFEKVKKDKFEINDMIRKIVNKRDRTIDQDDDVDDSEDDYELFENHLEKMNNTNDQKLRRDLVNKLMQMIKNKYEAKLNKLLLQESILCKINDSADDFDSLKNIRSKLKHGDIIEFKRFGYSHFSIYLSNNTILQYETPMYNNITVKNIFSNFPSLTLISKIDSISHNDLVRVNNKLRLNLPVNLDEINERIQTAINKNTSIKYNIFLNNCEHFTTFIRFGISFSDQIEALFKVANDITHPFRKIVFDTFF